MATYRGYQTVEESSGKFDEFILKLRKRGDLSLPPERELGEIIGCSRNTLRKLLDIKEAQGIIIKGQNGRTLSLETLTNRKLLGRFSFVAEGASMVGNPAWAKLWHRLQQKAEAAGICAELVLVPYELKNIDWNSFENSLSDVIIVTTLKRDVINFLLALNGKTLITTEEHYRGKIENIIALDNFKAGELAAQTLAARGYKKPAMICDLLFHDGQPYTQYVKRIEGFKKGCADSGLYFDEHSLLIVEGSKVKLMVGIAKRGMELVQKGFDSVFLHTDVDLGFLMEGIASEGAKVPEDIGVITLNSFDKAVSSEPAVSSVAHGTEPMSDKIVEKLRELFTGAYPEFGEILVTPGLHEGSTLK